MKKALLVSLYNNFNYGNRLQNYAVYRLLSERNIEVLNLKNNRHLNYIDRGIVKSYIKFYLSNVKYFILNRNKYGWKYYNKRLKNFKKFSDNINTSKKYFTYHDLKNYNNFDYYVVGSDQVWNPFMSLDDLTLFRGFNSSNKIAISASFGVSKFDNYNDTRLCNSLKDFKAISVREQAGKVICDKLLKNSSSQVLIDPTMMIDVDEWRKISKKPEWYNTNKYILVAFLGKIDEKILSQIKSFAETMDYEIIDIYDGKKNYSSCGPSEFLYLEDNAQIVFTDSFHSTVFSILFNTPFITFERNGTHENMNSRIQTLLSKFNLTTRIYNGTLSKKILRCDFSNVALTLTNERVKFKTFLDNSLAIKDSDKNE